jgi:hypothetical protein
MDRGAPMAAEPQHRRPAGGDSGNRGGGERAVPRGSGSSASPAPSAPASGNGGSRGGSTASTAGSNGRDAQPGHERAVPSWGRPRGDRPSSGTAVQRTTPPIRGGSGGYYGRYYDPYFPYGFAYPGYGLGLGFGLYDPWYDPWGAGYYGGGYGGYGYGGYGYGGDSGYSPYSYGAQGYATEEEGSLRLKVKPRDAKVYVDGYFVGTVDSFDGAFQKLKVPGGHHRIEIRADGYESAEFDVLVTPDKTLTYQGELKKIL